MDFPLTHVYSQRERDRDGGKCRSRGIMFLQTLLKRKSRTELGPSSPKPVPKLLEERVFIYPQKRKGKKLFVKLPDMKVVATALGVCLESRTPPSQPSPCRLLILGEAKRQPKAVVLFLGWSRPQVFSECSSPALASVQCH